MNSRSVVALLFLCSSSFAGILPQPTLFNFDLYLSPTGFDTSSGLSPVTALATLSRAQDVLKSVNPQMNVVIHVASGTYYNQSVVWNWTRPNFLLTIKGEGPTKPIFDGCKVYSSCQKITFFEMNSATGQASNVTIDNLQIQRYWMGISLNGNYIDFSLYNWNNKISNNVFVDIGNGFSTSLPYSFTAVRLYNSRNNLVTHNRFQNVINMYPYHAYIHGIYAASWSSSNVITYNSFENISGDPVRLRDMSNYNWIGDNQFTKTGFYSAASDWYCAAPDSCQKIECPSRGNTFSSNQYGLNYSLRSMTATAVFGSNSVLGCPMVDLNTARISSLSNVFMLTN